MSRREIMLDFRLEKIEIKGFKDNDNGIIMEFAKGQTTTIYGANGCGKTTLLRIVTAIFDRNTQVLLNEKVQSIKLEMLKNGNRETVEINLNSNFIDNKIDQTFNWDICNNFLKGKVLFITTDRGLSDYRRKIDIRDLHTYLANQDSDLVLNKESSYSVLSHLIDFLNGTVSKLNASDLYSKDNLLLENIKMETLEELIIKHCQKVELLKRSKIKINIFEELMNLILVETDERKLKDKKYKMKQKEAKIKYNEFINRDKIMEKFEKYRYIITEIMDSEEDSLFQKLFHEVFSVSNIEENSRIIESKENKLNFINKLVEIIEDNEKELFLIENLQLSFGNFIKNKELIISEDKVYIKGSNYEHSLSELSNGEKHILTFIVVLAFIGKEKDVIMIDEPGISLDTDWQEILVEEIEKLCPHSQIILTTHSPDISMNNTNMMKTLTVNPFYKS